ncbi:ankyrin repeat-containing domain protein [Xylariomycetidae sp. FL0641]|nr:ankyrin repeat-containing domain protein [Xylariomycetidae sp. FL0641]
MSSLLSLPTEMLLEIAERVPRCCDLSALARSSRGLYAAVDPILYQMAAKKGSTNIAFFWAVAAGRLQTVRRFLHAGQRINEPWSPMKELGTDKEAYNSFHNLIAMNTKFASEEDAEAEALFFERPMADPASWSAIHIAARTGNLDMMQLLLDRGANVNAIAVGFYDCGLARDSLSDEPWSVRFSRATPLNVAICSGHEATARLLVRHGASPYIDSPTEVLEDGAYARGITALHAACQYGLLSFAKFLVERQHQCDVNEPDSNGETPLRAAYRAGHKPCVDWLIQRGAQLSCEVPSHSDSFW